VIYLDTSAVMKLVVPEAYSADLGSWILKRGDSTLISSQLLRVELLRAVRRREPAKLAQAEAWLRSIDSVAISTEVVERAAGYPDEDLRSLDAIHLATAERISEAATEPLEAFVVYDLRLREAAKSHGLPASSPGMEA